ncbi:MAG: hypothetical protein ACLR8Y_19010 [Alistipes indistinctus]
MRTNIGNSAIGAKINHKIESIFTPIQSGDQIEINHFAECQTEDRLAPRPCGHDESGSSASSAFSKEKIE